jgi:peroxiredoxin
LLDSAIVHSEIERHRGIASEIRSKVTRLLRGYEPPEFSLYNQDSVLVSLQNYRGKYVYLMFCTTQNYICFSQYKLLDELYKVHNKWLDIVIISVDDKLSDMRNFRQKSGYQWDFLHSANDPEVVRKYDVRIYPTCFLIDPEGKLVLSPAPAPASVYEYDPEEGTRNLERTLLRELTGKGVYQEYIQKGWITAPPSQNKFNQL